MTGDSLRRVSLQDEQERNLVLSSLREASGSRSPVVARNAEGR